MIDREREVLDRGRVEIDLRHLLDGRAGLMDGPIERLLVHDAAQRAEIERYREALERVVVECGSDLMSCDCAPPKQGEACSRCEIEYVARTALEADTGGQGE